MEHVLRAVDRRTQLMAILLLFWALFWLLNGGDKFFNSSPEPNTAAWSRSAVITNGTDNIVGEIHPVLPDGFYGVSRNNKMVNYFDRLGLPEPVALTALYSTAVVEVLIGLGFAALFALSAGPQRWRDKKTGTATLFGDRVVHRLCFKASVAVFGVFAVADTLFGDRVELWEHGTFMVLVLVTYDLWYRTDTWTQDRDAEVAGSAPGGVTSRGRSPG